MWTAPTRGLPKWSSSEATDENKASLERRCGDCRACAFRASLGATSQSIGRKLDGYAGSQPRRAGSDAVQHGRTSIGPDASRREGNIGTDQYPAHSFGLRHNLGDAAKAPSCARPPCGEHSPDAPCPWPQVGDGYHRTAQPSRAGPPAGGCSPDGRDAATGPDAQPVRGE
jgi:hypothetical protein